MLGHTCTQSPQCLAFHALAFGSFHAIASILVHATRCGLHGSNASLTNVSASTPLTTAVSVRTLCLPLMRTPPVFLRAVPPCEIRRLPGHSVTHSASMQCILMNSERCRSVLAHAICMHCMKLAHVYLAHISRAVITLISNCMPLIKAPFGCAPQHCNV
jgi:hypothetical protein